MADLGIECAAVDGQRHGAAPTLLFRLRVRESTGQRVDAIALRCQLRVEPLRRAYSDRECGLLADVFGERGRWSQTARPMQFAHAAVMVPSFTGEVEVEVAVPVTYDLEVATGKYLHALEGGAAPMVMLFSGTVFGRAPAGLSVEPVPWRLETRCDLPVAVWRALMDEYFPDSGWLRLHRETLDELARYKAARAIATWDETVAALLATAEQPMTAEPSAGGIR